MLCGTVDQGACGNEALPPEFVSRDIKLVPRGNTHTASKDRVMPLEELTEYACTRRRRFWPQKQMTCTALGDQNATKHGAICANEICKRGTSDGLIRVVDSRKIHATYKHKSERWEHLADVRRIDAIEHLLTREQRSSVWAAEAEAERTRRQGQLKACFRGKVLFQLCGYILAFRKQRLQTCTGSINASWSTVVESASCVLVTGVGCVLLAEGTQSGNGKSTEMRTGIPWRAMAPT
jgi:hypothetical protein